MTANTQPITVAPAVHKRPGPKPKADADLAKTRAVRLTDADWSDLKLIGLDRARELVRKEATKVRAKA